MRWHNGASSYIKRAQSTPIYFFPPRLLSYFPSLSNHHFILCVPEWYYVVYMFCIFWSIHFTVQLSLAALVPFPFDPCLSITIASCDTSIWKNLKCFHFVLCSFVLFCSRWLYEFAYASIVTGVLFLHIPTSIYYLICFGPGSFFLGWRTSSSWCDLHFLYDYQYWRTEHLSHIC